MPPSRELAQKAAITQMITYHAAHEDDDEDHRDKKIVHAGVKEGELLPVYGTSEAEIAKHGTGLGVYFASVRWISCYLFFAFAANSPSLFMNYDGGYRDSSPTGLVYNYTEWGGDLSIGHIDPTDREFQAFYHVAFSFLTAIAMAYYGSCQQSLAAKHNANNDTAADFCVELKGLPPTATSAEITQYFRDQFFKDLGGHVGAPEIQQIIITKRVAKFLEKYREQRVLKGQIVGLVGLIDLLPEQHPELSVEERDELEVLPAITLTT